MLKCVRIVILSPQVALQSRHTTIVYIGLLILYATVSNLSSSASIEAHF